jgi:type II secretory pathway component PulF
MPSFEYSAVDSNGQQTSGTVLGLSLADAAKQLADRGLTVEKINVAQFLGDPLANESMRPSQETATNTAVQPPPGCPATTPRTASD